MPLIECPDCQREVSDRAPACPDCGCPIAPQAIEKTSKLYKGVQVWSLVAMVVALQLTCNRDRGPFGETTPSPWPPFLLAGSVAVYLGARASAWWDHG